MTSNRDKTLEKINSITEQVAIIDIQLARDDLPDSEIERLVEVKTQLAIDMSIANEYLANDLTDKDNSVIEEYLLNGVNNLHISEKNTEYQSYKICQPLKPIDNIKEESDTGDYVKSDILKIKKFDHNNCYMQLLTYIAPKPLFV